MENLAEKFGSDEDDLSVNVTVFDVGFGDSIYVKFKNGNKEKSFLIDCGTARAISKKLAFLRSEGVDYIILTHKHPDHIGGVKKVVEDEDINVKGIILRDDDWAGVVSRSAEKLKKLIDDNVVPHYVLTDDKVKKELESFKILYPINVEDENSNIYRVYNNPNKNSIALALDVGREKILLMADATETEENFIIKNSKMDFTKVKYVKLGHHGSNTSTGANFVRCIGNEKNRVGIVSCNGSNSHPPHKEYIEEIWRSRLMYTENGSEKGDIEIDECGARKLE